MKAVDTVVLGKVATEQGVVEEGCVAISGGKVVGLLAAGHVPEAGQRIAFPGCLILPGMVDSHVHSQHSNRGTPGEGFTKTSAAAAAGGVTFFMDHPQDIGGAVTSAEYMAEKKALCETQSLLDFALWGAGILNNLQEIEPMARAGVVGFKMFMSECRYMDRVDDGTLFALFQEIARVGGVAAVHAETQDIITHIIRKFQAEGKVTPERHLESCPDVTEMEAVMRAVEYAKWTGVDLHVCHISLAKAVEYVHRQRIEYPRLTAETCAQYLTLSDDLLKTRGSYAKIQPPLRKAGENEALWEQVRLGHVDSIGSDHGPHKHAVKTRASVFDCHAGSPNIETMVPVMFSEGVMKGRLPVERFVTLLSGAPARRFGVYPQKGALLPRSDADLTVIDPAVEWEIRAADLHQTSGWTNFEGFKVRGKPIMTMVRGRAVYREGEILGKPGDGRFVPSAHAARARAL